MHYTTEQRTIFQQLRFTSVCLIFADRILLEMERNHMAQMMARENAFNIFFFRGTHSDKCKCYRVHVPPLTICDTVPLMLFGWIIVGFAFASHGLLECLGFRVTSGICVSLEL